MAGRVMAVRALVVVALVLCAGTSTARAEQQGPLVVAVENSMAARFSPLGVAGTTRVALRWHPVARNSVLRKSALGDQLFSNTYLGAGTLVDVTPAFVRSGFFLDISPLTIWRIRLNWQALQSFGLFNQFLPFDSAGANYDAFGKRDALRAAGGLQPRMTQRFLVDNMLQLRVWKLVLLNQSIAEYAVLGPGYYYNGEYDFLVRGEGELVVRNILLGGIVLLDRPNLPELAVGGFHMWTRALGARLQNQQVGASVVMAPVVGKRQPRGFTMIAVMGFHLEHSHRRNHPFMAWLVNFTFM